MHLTLDHVDYLHDGEVASMRLDIDESGRRKVIVSMRCTPDCGLLQLNGRLLDLVFNDAILVVSTLFAYGTRVDTFDAWRNASSPNFKSQLDGIVSMGVSKPREKIELVFHSGSVLEIGCDSIDISYAD